jgi:hypothetical protein
VEKSITFIGKSLFIVSAILNTHKIIKEMTASEKAKDKLDLYSGLSWFFCLSF